MWAESNADDGAAQFWFGTLWETTTPAAKLLTWDATRDIWVLLKPPPPAADAPPLTAQQLSTAVILLAIGGTGTALCCAV